MLTKEQLLDRKKGIGGSDVAAILGISPFKDSTPLSVYLDKISDEVVEKEMTPAMEFGNEAEPWLGDVYARKQSVLVSPTSKTYNKVRYPFIIGTPDFFIAKPKCTPHKILECKTVGFHAAKNWDNGIPLYYLTQVAHYAMIFEMPVDVIALINNEFKIFSYERNEELEANLLAAEQKFWEQNVLVRVPPTATCLADVKKLYKIAEPKKTIIATDEVDAAMYDMARLSKQIAALEEQKESLEFVVKNHIKDAEILLDKNGLRLATYASHKTTKFDSKAFSAAHPDLKAKFSKETDSRTFLNKIKETD